MEKYPLNMMKITVLIEGDGGQIHRTVSDFNEDGLIDLYVHTQNYHGRDGYQPDFYIDGCPWNTYEKLFLNNGDGFEKIEIDDKDTQVAPTIDIIQQYMI